MHSVTQKTCYVVPTSRVNEHHSQASFDPLQSLVVKPLGPKKVNTGLYKDCWAPEFSAPRLAQKSAKAILIRESTSHSTFEPWAKNSKECLSVSTATIPKTGLIKLIPSTGKSSPDYYESHHISNSPFRLNAPTKQRRNSGSAEKKPSLFRNKTYHVGMPNTLTVNDIRHAINNKYPETNGLAFSRASTFLKETAIREKVSRLPARPTNTPVSQEKLVNSYLRATEPLSFDSLPTRTDDPPSETPASPGSHHKTPIHVDVSADSFDQIDCQDLLLEGSLPERNYSHSIDSA